MQMKKIILILVTFMLLWAGWYFCYPNYLRGLEGFSFFSTLPDFAGLSLDMPRDFFKYIGAFLLQFYANPAVAAAFQALFPVLVILCTYVMVRRLSDDNERLMWVAFLPLPVVLYYQLNDFNLARTLTILTCTVLIMLVVCAATYKRKPFKSMPAFMHNRYVALVLILVSVGITASILLNNQKVTRMHEDVAYLEYLGENQKWDEILETVSVQDAAKYEFKRKYVLLALSEKGQLPDYAFRYGLSSASDFVYDTPQDPLQCKFNTIYYRAIGKNNPAAYNLYLYTLHAVSGLTFYWIRTLADMYIEYKDYLLAKKYVDILSHSTCHGKWVRERLPKLEAIKDVEPEYPSPDDRFFMEYFAKDISNLVIRNQSDHKYAAYLLCSALAEKDSGEFLFALDVLSPSLYPDGRIPRLYQEALLILLNQDPDLEQKYKIDDEVRADFEDFNNLVRSGKGGHADRKYAGTYWAYLY